MTRGGWYGQGPPEFGLVVSWQPVTRSVVLEPPPAEPGLGELPEQSTQQRASPGLPGSTLRRSRTTVRAGNVATWARIHPSPGRAVSARSITSANADACDLRYRSDAREDRVSARPLPDGTDSMIMKDLVPYRVLNPS
jgi:hypothetical protein